MVSEYLPVDTEELGNAAAKAASVVNADSPARKSNEIK